MASRVTASNDLRAGRLGRPARLLLALAALAGLALVPAAEAQAQRFDSVPAGLASQSVDEFYAARAGRPLWLDSSAGDAAPILLELLRTAEADGLNPRAFHVDELAHALRAASGGPPDLVRRADRLLSEAFVAYVGELKRAPPAGIHWVDPQLKPQAPAARHLLEVAAKAHSLEQWVEQMGWMNPIYAGLRRAIVDTSADDPALYRLRLNRERARALPSGDGRYIIVNATAARLEAYEDGRLVDSMRVVVGKPKNPTPMMAALIRFTSLNPYWYVPPDLTAERIAPNVVKEGIPWLAAQGYQVMANWNDPSTMIDPATIDWKAVADGRKQIWVRQLPGPNNSMGRMKFMFPNDQGIYLHDTPNKELLSEPSRMFSGGCVRLEDAPRLARWLYGRDLVPQPGTPEQRIDLPSPVPVYITYLTMLPEGTELATYPDVYGRDRDELAMVGGGATAAR